MPLRARCYDAERMRLGPPLHRSLTGLALSLTAISLVACDYCACGSSPRRPDFGPLDRAARIEVIWNGTTPLTTTTDPTKVQAARAFIERHRDGWVQSWTGHTIGARQLVFIPTTVPKG